MFACILNLLENMALSQKEILLYALHDFYP